MAEAFTWGVKVVAECRKLEGLVARYQRCWEQLKEDKEAEEDEKKDLQRQLDEALSKAKAKAAA